MTAIAKWFKEIMYEKVKSPRFFNLIITETDDLEMY